MSESPQLMHTEEGRHHYSDSREEQIWLPGFAHWIRLDVLMTNQEVVSLHGVQKGEVCNLV